MKKLLVIIALFVSFMPLGAQAQDASACALYNPPQVWDGTKCVAPNATNPADQRITVTQTTGTGGTNNGTTPTPTTGCPNGGQLVNDACNLGYVPLEPIPGFNDNVVDPNQLPKLINSIFTMGITLGALLAVLMLTVGGIQYMISESVGGKKAGIDRAKSALWGILLVAGAYLILHTINPNLLSLTYLNPCASGAGCSVNVASAPNSNVPITSGTSVPLTQAQLNTLNQQGIELSSSNQKALVLNNDDPNITAQLTSFKNSCGSAKVQPASNFDITAGANQTVYICAQTAGINEAQNNIEALTPIGTF